MTGWEAIVLGMALLSLSCALLLVAAHFFGREFEGTPWEEIVERWRAEAEEEKRSLGSTRWSAVPCPACTDTCPCLAHGDELWEHN